MKPEQKRKERIEILVEWGRDRRVTTIDGLLNRAREEFSFSREETLEDYARDALRIILREKKHQNSNQV